AVLAPTTPRRKAKLSPIRWHGNELTSPRQMRTALVYVLQNHAQHSRSHAERALGGRMSQVNPAGVFRGGHAGTGARGVTARPRCRSASHAAPAATPARDVKP